MRNTRRNIADPISPQNPVIRKDIQDGDDRIQDHLEEKTSVEDIYGDLDESENAAKINKSGKSKQSENPDLALEDEAGL